MGSSPSGATATLPTCFKPAPVTLHTTVSSPLMTPSPRRRMAAAREAAPDGSAKMPAKRPRRPCASRISRSVNATPAPLLARTARSARSPRALGSPTRMLSATVGPATTGSTLALPFWSAATMGAAARLWAAASRGNRCAQPRACNSPYPFHMAARPAPPAVGCTIQWGTCSSIWSNSSKA